MAKINKPVLMDKEMIDAIETKMAEQRVFSFGEMSRRLIQKGLNFESIIGSFKTILFYLLNEKDVPNHIKLAAEEIEKILKKDDPEWMDEAKKRTTE